MKKTLILILFLVVSFGVGACSTEMTERTNKENQELKDHNEVDSIDVAGKVQNKEIPTFNADQLLNDYKTIFINLIKNAENTGKVKDFQSKQELIKYFQVKMSKEFATQFVESYFDEKQGDLYIKRKESPIWIMPDQMYRIVKINDQEYQIIQEQNNQPLGHIEIIFKVVYNGENWVVHDLQKKKVVASKWDNISKADAVFLVREHLGLQGNNMLHVEVDHEEDDKYIVHVYEIVQHEDFSHTATYGWYYVYKNSGKIEDMMR